MKLNSFEKNAFETVLRFCKIANIRATKSGLYDILLQNPHFPSMQSLRETFISLNVPNLAVRIDPLLLSRISLPAIVYLDGNIGYATVERVEEDMVEWFHNNSGPNVEHITSFSRKWNGISLVMEPNQSSGEIEYEKSNWRENVTIFNNIIVVSAILIFSITSLLFYRGDMPIIYGSLLLTSIVGSILSVLIFKGSIVDYSNFWRPEKILNFPPALRRIINYKIFKNFPQIQFYDFALIYFSGAALFLANSESRDGFVIVKILNIASMTLVVWLAYVQVKLKTWCVHCMLITALLLLQFIVLLEVDFQAVFQSISFRELLVSFLIPILIWVSVKSPLISASLERGHFYTIKRMMFGPAYLRSTLKRGKTLPPRFSGMEAVGFGDEKATHRITLLLNPICHACRKAFSEARKLVSENPHIRCDIFLAVSRERSSLDHVVASAVLGSSPDKTVDNLSDWFTKMPVPVEQWVVGKIIDKQAGLRQLDYHSRWCELSGLKSDLPTIIVNESELPPLYSVSDVKRILMATSNAAVEV